MCMLNVFIFIPQFVRELNFNTYLSFFAEAELRVLNVSKIAEPEVTYKPSSGGSFSLPSENLRRISKGRVQDAFYFERFLT